MNIYELYIWVKTRKCFWCKLWLAKTFYRPTEPSIVWIFNRSAYQKIKILKPALMEEFSREVLRLAEIYFCGWKKKFLFRGNLFLAIIGIQFSSEFFFSLLMNSKQMFEEGIWIYLFIYLSIYYIFIVGSLQTQSCI